MFISTMRVEDCHAGLHRYNPLQITIQNQRSNNELSTTLNSFSGKYSN
jgi:hypothetical protein